MTTAVPTLVEQQADLIHKLHQVLTAHPVGGAFRLMYAPRELDVPADAVLVQVTDPQRGVLELHPRPLAGLGSGDVLHATQVVDPADTALSTYAREARARSCMMVPHDNGTSHHYVG